MRFFSFFRDRNIKYLVIIFFFSLITLTWNRGSLILKGDLSLPLNPIGALKNNLYFWSLNYAGQEIFSFFGLPYVFFWAFLKKIGLSLINSQMISFFITTFVMAGGMYFLILSLPERKKSYYHICALISSFFYIFNLYVVLLYPITPAYSYLLMGMPFALGVFIRGLESKKKVQVIKNAVLLGLVVSFSTPSLYNFPILVILLAVYFLYHFFLQRRSVYFYVFFVFTNAVFILLLNLWFFMPLLFLFFGSSSIFLGENVVNIERLIFNSTYTTFLRLFQLLGSWAFYSFHKTSPYFSYAKYYLSNPFLILLTFIPAMMGILSLILKKNKKITFWGLLLIISLFLASGVYPDRLNLVNFVNKILFLNVPLFETFRDPNKFGILIMLALSVLVGFFVGGIFFELKKKNSSSSFFFLILSIFLILITSWPVVTGDVIQPKRGVLPSGRIIFPRYWNEAADYINTKKENFKLFLYPIINGYIAYTWGYQGGEFSSFLFERSVLTSVHSYFEYHNYQKIIKQLNEFHKEPKKNLFILAFLNSKYILVRNDIDLNFHEEELKFLKDIKLDKILKTIREVELEKIFNELHIYKISDNYFLPHFYIPQNIIYSNGSIEDLPEIVGLPDYQIRSGIYLGKINGLMDSKINELKERVNEVVVVGNLENGLEKDYFERLENFKNGVPFPYVKHQPGSFGWKRARLKEKYEEWKVRKDPEKLIDKKLYFAGKRIAEFEKFGTDNMDKTQITLIVDGYGGKMEEVIEEIKKLGNEEIRKEQVIKLRAYLEKHKEEIRKLGNYEIGKFGGWEEMFEEIDGKIKEIEKKFDLNNLEYKLEIPKEGEYTIYLEIPNSQSQITSKFQISNYNNNEETKKLGSWEIEAIEIDGERVEEELEKEEQWVRVGKVKLGEGEHKLVLRLLEGENLVGENWQELKNETATESGKVRFLVQEFFPQAENIVFQPIKNWKPGGVYYISFEYKTEGGSLGVSILEDIKDTGDIEYLSKTEKILDKKLKIRKIKKLENWEKFETIFPADINTLGAKIYFYSQPEPNKIANVEFRNVKIEKIREPKIVLRTDINNADKVVLPKITFVKVNPTKYRIKVEGAKEPYTLVFSESFHKGWKLYINELTDSRINELKNYGEIVASYFDGEIKEGTHRMTFLERATFETWGKKPIAEDRHYLVNGYANSWYITPDDAEGKENYELIVEFWPQRLFYIGLFISGATLAGCLSYLIYDKIKRIKN